MTKISRSLFAAVAIGGCSSSSDDTTATTSQADTGVTDGSGGDATGSDGDGSDTTGSDTNAEGCVTLSDGQCVTETFHNPPVLEPNADGVYELTLGAVEFMVDGKRQCGRAYNGMFPGPTIDTPAQVDGKPRQVRVNIRNTFTKTDYRSLTSQTCTCTDPATGKSCEPSHGAGHSMDMSCECKDENGDMCHVFDFNVTNLHAHGSHVRPDYAAGGGCVESDGLACRPCSGDSSTGAHECYFADDVISRVAEGKGAQHRWDIDEDHVSYDGLNWYHPHIHGSTAIQVASGATGAWIVRGPVDEMAGVKNAKERVFLISTPPVGYTPLADGQACDEDHITFNGFVVLGDTSEKQTNLINGLRQPRLLMAPGQIERWRFLHGSFLDEMTIAVFKGKDSSCKNLDFDAGPISLTQIGRDGITLPKPADGKDWPFAPPYLFLSPGYRIDTLIDGSALKDGDTLCMMSGRFLQKDTTGTTDIAVGITKAPTADEILQTTTNGDLIAIVNVTSKAGEPTETTMPDLAKIAEQAPSTMLENGTVDALAKCGEVKDIKQVDQLEQLVELWTVVSQQEGLDACACPDHNINCKNFEQTDREKYPYDRVLPLGSVEHWRVISGFDGHPFHIHINPYLVCPLPTAESGEPNAKGRLFEPPFAHWRDTYLVNLDRRADLITEYRKFTGAYVFHCHKLNHEDHGMMELIRVCDPKTESCDTLCSGGKCGWNQCAEGDNDCIRARTGAECMMDPSKCAEAVLRCLPCKGDAMTCPADAYCAADASPDGQRRCLPGCAVDDDCGPTSKCDAGECVPAACAGPCPPGKACVHGACL